MVGEVNIPFHIFQLAYILFSMGEKMRGNSKSKVRGISWKFVIYQITIRTAE